jgi:hypothetical protein
VLDRDRRELERFVVRDRRGHAPLDRRCRAGAASLGVLIDSQRPLRIADVGEDPKSYGFPRATRRFELIATRGRALVDARSLVILLREGSDSLRANAGSLCIVRTAIFVAGDPSRIFGIASRLVPPGMSRSSTSTSGL